MEALKGFIQLSDTIIGEDREDGTELAYLTYIQAVEKIGLNDLVFEG